MTATDYQEVARFKLPLSMTLFGELCMLYSKHYKDAIVEQQGEWMIIKQPIKPA